jgi:hypothetical protein
MGDTSVKMSRRDFMLSVGSATAVISGWVLVPGCTIPHSGKNSGKGFCPKLADGISSREIPGGGELLQLDERGAWQIVGHVNEYGLKILKSLNGNHTLQNLAAELHQGFDPAKLGQTEASVASFLAILAQAGLLAEPFFVNLHAVEITA